MEAQSAINDGYVFQADDSSQNSNDFSYDKGYIPDSEIQESNDGNSDFIMSKDPSQEAGGRSFGDDNDSSSNYPESGVLSTENKWKVGIKRFNEFLGKRNLITSSFPKWKFLWLRNHPGLKEISPSDEEKLMEIMSNMKGDSKAVWSKLFNTSDKRRKEMLLRLYRNVYRMITAKDTPKRQYEFVGKRFEDDNEPVMGRVLAADDDQDKRYEFLGKKSYDFLGKRNYDFLGKKSYDFLGKKSYDFLGKKSYDFLGKKSYDFLGKRDYDFLGKRPYVGDKRSYDFLGKRKQDLLDGAIAENPDNDRGSIGRIANEGNFGPKMLLPPNMHHTHRRYSEWLGKKKRSSMPISTQQRLALLLRDNTLRKRLSRMLMNSRVGSHQAPEFIGK